LRSEIKIAVLAVLAVVRRSRGTRVLNIVTLNGTRGGRLIARCPGLLSSCPTFSLPDDPLHIVHPASFETTMNSSAVAVSAPGKVLLAGGYLVLDRKYNGLVFGLDARIHVSVKPFASSSGVAFSEITVKSPQFQNAVWEYGYRLAAQDGGVKVTQLRV
jgi:hypothetical protein